MYKFISIFLFVSLFSFHSQRLSAQDSLELEEVEALALYTDFMDSINAILTYETGTITLHNGLAMIEVPPGFKYLNASQSEMVLTDLWGNPPSEEGYGSLGMLFLEDETPFSDESYAINITYTEDGYVDDADAKDIDFNELLEIMIEDTKESSEYRSSIGYETVELLGWAEEPFYDQTSKKLHWAKELSFGESEEHTLNYNIRVLGRRGYLELNAISGMSQLGAVQSAIEPILASVQFNEGNRYADFVPGADKMAAYGIGALIAGKMLAKAGILAKIGIFALKFWKVGLLALVGLGAGIRKYFSVKSSKTITPESSEM